MSSRHPIVKWAQRSDRIFITVDLPDSNDVKLKLEPHGRFIFSATKDGILYEVDVELFDKVNVQKGWCANVQESKYSIGVRDVVYVTKKQEKKWWSRLSKQEGKPPVFLKVDWDKWVDEEDENDHGRTEFDNMDFSVRTYRKEGQKQKKKKNPLNQLLGKLGLDCLGKPSS